MRNILKVIASAIFLLLFYCCTKPNDTNPQPPGDPSDSIPVTPKDTIPFIKAGFSVQADCNASYFTDTLQNLFAPLQFINTSDAGKKVHYRWSFGDNTFSDSINPTHTYIVAGTYPVQLITYYDTIPTDTITRLLRIIIGQKKHSFDRHISGVVDADNAPGNGAMVLTGSSNPGGGYSYTLLRTDSLLNQIFLKPLPATSIRLNSLQQTKSGNYILSGNYNSGNTDQYAISLIDLNGNLIWQNYLTVHGTNYFTSETMDGGFITIGDEATGSGAFTTIVKCNSSGNELWRRSFNATQQKLNAANKIMETASGYVFAAMHNYGVMNLIPDIVITSLDFKGNVLQQKAVAINWHTSSGVRAEIATSGDTYVAYLPTCDSVCIYNKNLDYKETKRLGNLPINNIAGYDNNYYISAGNESGYVLRSNENGELDWGTKALIPVSCSSGNTYNTIRYKRIIEGQKDFIAVGFLNETAVAPGICLMRITPGGEVR